MVVESNQILSSVRGTSRGRKWVRFVAGLRQSKWVVIMAAIWIQCCSGSSYNFGMYSEAVKTALSYDQGALETLATFKDLGANVGVFAGCVFDYFPLAGVLGIGAVQSWFGFGMLWLSVTGLFTSPQLWQTCLYIFLGANAQTFFNTACVVTCVHHFPTNRGIVIGLMKGFLGLSGALLTQLFYAIFPEDDGSSFLLLVSCLPPLMALLLIPVLRPAEAPSEQRKENNNLYLLSAMAVALAAYLTVVIVVENTINVSHAAIVCVCVVFVALLLLPAGVAVKAELEESSITVTAAPPIQDSLKAPLLGSDDMYNQEDDEDRKFLLPIGESDVLPGPRDVEDGQNFDNSQKNEASTSYTKLPHLPDLENNMQHTQIARTRGPRRGEDHTFFQALCTADFWLIFMGLACGMGSGLTAIDNMGQIGTSLGYTPANVGTIISLLSIWNFLGRFGFGALSEFGLHRFKLGRPVWLVSSQAAMFFGHLLIGSAIPGSLYVGSIIIGLCYGAQWSVVPAITSEIFGLSRFATLFNTITIASPIGTYFFSVQLAGRLYDIEARREQALVHSNHSLLRWFNSSGPEGTLECYGPHCFRLTFIILSAVSLLGCMFYLILARRTSLFYSREVYAQLSLSSTAEKISDEKPTQEETTHESKLRTSEGKLKQCA